MVTYTLIDMYGLDDLVQSASDYFGPSRPAEPAAPAPVPAHQHHGHHHHDRPAANPPAAAPRQEGQGVLDILTDTLAQTGRGVAHAIDVEGVGALSDIDGMADRIRSREELAGRFHVVGDRFRGRREQNTVTEAEFEETVRTYSNIHLQRGDLTIDPARVSHFNDPAHPTAQLSGDDRVDWERGTMDDIARILQTRVGREEIGLLSNNPRHHHTTIAPRLDRFGHLSSSNAETRALDPASAAMHGRRPGAGSDVEVDFVPRDNMYQNEISAATEGGPPVLPWQESMRSDVGLFHELTHALYATLGREDDTDIKEADGSSRGVRADARYRDKTGDLLRAEHQGVGLGRYAHSRWGENRYRMARRQMGRHHVVGVDEGTPGAHDGDADMTRRDRYVEPR